MRYRAGLETQDRILNATRTLIADAGLEGTTIKGICDRAGVLPGSFYNLFASKEQAILSVVREAIDAVDPDPQHLGTDTLHELVDAYVRFITEQGDLARVYIGIAVSGRRNDTELKGRVMRHHQGRVSRFASAIRRERPDLDPAEAERRAETLVSALNGLTLRHVLDPVFDVAMHAHSLRQQALA
ncbi:MAG: TetR/AcrR family transcriptional regulator [Actinobacteria bacterium]|nr:TetR/AcrR family transcriptional regulator [Actinomycetota bacterium]MCI0543802.1 TetR/AcrR family transcriptional regulator [Actinomycetota bacterium]